VTRWTRSATLAGVTVDPLGLLNPLPRRSRRWLWLGLAAGALVVLVGGGTALALTGGHHPATTAAASPSLSPTGPAIFPTTAAPATTSGVAPEIQQACDLNDKLDPSADLASLKATVYKIDQLVTDVDNFDVRFAGHMLKDRYDLALAGKGSDAGPRYAIEFLTAHIKLSTACIQAGWRH
jgi:hypothetical protein